MELQIQLPQSRPRCTLRRDTRVVGPAPDVGGLLLRLIRISILSSYCPWASRSLPPSPRLHPSSRGQLTRPAWHSVLAPWSLLPPASPPTPGWFLGLQAIAVTFSVGSKPLRQPFKGPGPLTPLCSFNILLSPSGVKTPIRLHRPCALGFHLLDSPLFPQLKPYPPFGSSSPYLLLTPAPRFKLMSPHQPHCVLDTFFVISAW